MKATPQRIEAAVMLLVVCAVAYMSGARATDWSASIAVFLGFLYSQRAFDIAEANASPDATRGPAAESLRLIYTIKECAWMTTFWMVGSYPMLAGAVMFATYPAARQRLRSAIRSIER